MRIVITGVAGFLGSHLARSLLARDYEVIGLDNLLTGRRSNISDLERKSTFTFIEQDVTDYTEVPGQIDAVMHLASPASPKDFDEMPIKILKANGMGTHRMLGLALAKKAKFVLASTSEVYGNPLVHPQSESYWGNVNPNGRRSVYDESKRYAEALTFAYHRHHGLDVAIVRTFNTYGPFMRADDGRVVSNFVVDALQNKPLTIYGDGNHTRSFCYVDDQIRGYLTVLDADHITGPVNIGNPVEMKVIDLARLVIEMTGSNSEISHRPLPPDDPSRRCPDITMARDLLGWSPTVDMREGLEKTIAYFRTAMN